MVVCVAQYWTTLTTDVDLHFQMASALMGLGLAAILALVLKRDWSFVGPELRRSSLAARLRDSVREAGSKRNRDESDESESTQDTGDADDPEPAEKEEAAQGTTESEPDSKS